MSSTIDCQYLNNSHHNSHLGLLLTWLECFLDWHNQSAKGSKCSSQFLPCNLVSSLLALTWNCVRLSGYFQVIIKKLTSDVNGVVAYADITLLSGTKE